MSTPAGPLAGITVVEFAGLGPAPFAGMLLADMGARVIRIDRPPRPATYPEGMDALLARSSDVLARGRESICLDLKSAAGRDVALRLIERADALIEGFRPGVMESLGLGPQLCLERCPTLIYGRVTGWGQDGPLAQAPGHDINFLGLSGALHSTARRGGPPIPTPGLMGDFGGGGMLLVFGLLCALLEARSSGQGQVIDASICDGSALLASLIYGWRSAGLWNSDAGTNNGDGGADFYNTYICADGRYVAIGAMEPTFYRRLLHVLEVDHPAFEDQWNASLWPQRKSMLRAIFRTKTRQAWCALLEGSDTCFAPVLDLDEAPRHPHNVARKTFATVDGITQPAPAPRFSRTPPPPCKPVGELGAQGRALLRELGFEANQIEDLLGYIASPAT